ncbi:MAG: 2-oxoacid:ferredoxin oxidoreductase subunit beta, partial [Mycobacteriaceae bacterium]
HRLIPLTHGEPLIFGPAGEHCVVHDGLQLAVVDTATVDAADIVVHDATTDNPEYAFALSRLSDQELTHTVTGVFRKVAKPTYDDLTRQQVQQAKDEAPAGAAALQTLLNGRDTWTVD